MKTYLLAAGAMMFACATPAFAQDSTMKCDDASMMKMQTEMDAMTDPAMKEQKDMAMKHMEMAKASMKEGKMDDCTMHMGEASKEMMKK